MAEDWLVDVRKYAPDADEGVVGAIVRYCGIALQSRDSSLVAMSDKKERDLVRENYLKKKLGLVHDDATLDEAVIAVGQVMKEDRTKNRVTVYYLLAQHFGLLNMFGGAVGVAGAAGVAAAAMGAGDGNGDDDANGATAAPLAAAGLGAAGIAAAAAPAVEPVSTYAAPTPPSEPVAAYSTYDNDVDTGGGGGLGWLKWLLLAAVLLALIFFGMRYCSNQAVQPAADTAATAGETADAANTVATPSVEPAATAIATPAAAVPEGSGVTTGERGGRPMLTVYFDTGKSAVSNDLAAAASKLKEYMTKNPDAKIAVSGFNDPTGNAAANAELSKNRAKAVAKAVADTGIPAASIGLEKPAETTGTGTSNAESRRVEVVVKP